MAAGKNKIEYITETTPIGELRYCNFGKLDQYGKKGCQLILDINIPEHKAFIEKLQKMNKTFYDEAITKITQKRSEYRMIKLPEPVENEEKPDAPATQYIIKARTSGERLLKVVDALKADLTEEQKNKVFSGSKGRLIIAMKKNVLGAPHYKIGYGVYLSAVQVTELVAPGASQADISSFGEVPDGFTADKAAEDEVPPTDY